MSTLFLFSRFTSKRVRELSLERLTNVVCQLLPFVKEAGPTRPALAGEG